MANVESVCVAAKRCSRCQQLKPLTEFYTRKGTKDGLRCECKICGKMWENKKARKQLLKKYGLAFDDYKKLFIRQRGVCAICGEPQLNGSLCVDHNHENGKVRGLLCFRCNFLIGQAKDDINILKIAMEYLERN